MLTAKTVAAPVFPNCKSASGVTVVMTLVEVLFKMLVSVVGEVTFATFVSEPLAGAVTVTVTLLTCNDASVPKFHTTNPPPTTPPPLALTEVTLLGNVSVTTTLLADDGPKFVTEIV